MSNHTVMTNPKPSFELSMSERSELTSLRLENNILKKLKATLSIKNKRDNDENTTTIRKQTKQIEKLQQEVNALKVASSRTDSEIAVNNKTLSRLPLKMLRDQSIWKGESHFIR